MRNISAVLLSVFFVSCGLSISMGQERISSGDNDKPESVKEDASETAGDMQTEGKDYELIGSLVPEEKHKGWTYETLHKDWLRNVGFDYTEHPHCNGIGGHTDGVHLSVVEDEVLKKPVFRFDIHITPVIDGDRCSGTDRQRNELKTATNNTTWSKVQGNWDEWQRLEWKMKIPKGLQPTQSFCHIHQIKAQDGPNNGSPVITITLRADRSGSNRRVQISHASSGGSGRSQGVISQAPLEEFEDEWVQIVEEMHFRHDGAYSIKIVRIRDGRELISVSKDNIDLWRRGATFLRSKYGIYRSLGGGNLRRTPAGQSPLLKNESIFMTDFHIYEKNTNPAPAALN